MIKVFGISRYDDDPYEQITDHIYLHGDLERMNGYDLVFIPAQYIPANAGHYKCEVTLWKTHETVPAVLFYWNAPHDSHIPGRKCGLICLPDDEEAIEYAIGKLLNKDDRL